MKLQVVQAPSRGPIRTTVNVRHTVAACHTVTMCHTVTVHKLQHTGGTWKTCSFITVKLRAKVTPVDELSVYVHDTAAAYRQVVAVWSGVLQWSMCDSGTCNSKGARPVLSKVDYSLLYWVKRITHCFTGQFTWQQPLPWQQQPWPSCPPPPRGSTGTRLYVCVCVCVWMCECVCVVRVCVKNQKRESEMACLYTRTHTQSWHIMQADVSTRVRVCLYLRVSIFMYWYLRVCMYAHCEYIHVLILACVYVRTHVYRFLRFLLVE